MHTRPTKLTDNQYSNSHTAEYHGLGPLAFNASQRSAPAWVIRLATEIGLVVVLVVSFVLEDCLVAEVALPEIVLVFLFFPVLVVGLDIEQPGLTSFSVRLVVGVVVCFVRVVVDVDVDVVVASAILQVFAVTVVAISRSMAAVGTSLVDIWAPYGRGQWTTFNHSDVGSGTYVYRGDPVPIAGLWRMNDLWDRYHPS